MKKECFELEINKFVLPSRKTPLRWREKKTYAKQSFFSNSNIEKKNPNLRNFTANIDCENG